MPVVSGERKIFSHDGLKNLLNAGKSVLKLEEIIWKNDYAQL
jgi:hypothetical protein